MGCSGGQENESCQKEKKIQLRRPALEGILFSLVPTLLRNLIIDERKMYFLTNRNQFIKFKKFPFVVASPQNIIINVGEFSRARRADVQTSGHC